MFKSVLTFGYKTWNLTHSQKSKLQAAKMKHFRRGRVVTKIDKIRNSNNNSAYKTKINEEIGISN